MNGDLAGYFQSARGLRQGCSLSPYLFVLCMNILSKKIDKAATERKFKFHPRCHSLSLTHLCFADDLMVFVEGSKDSIEGALAVFYEFAAWSGLKISLEKSTIYMAGVPVEEKSRILSDFPFAVGDLPVRYLGLPLMSQAMRSQDYQPLVEKIRGRINTWTTRFLSYAGRLMLIKSVLMSIVNFWSAAFRLPGQCIKEIEQLCSAFLWSGPSLKTTGAKVAWRDVCKEREEGGLGIRALKDVNKVSSLKLIWRLLTGDSLWSKWIKTNILKDKSFWEVKINSQCGSWMWRKLLKLREVAKSFYRKEIGNGRHTSFWFERWSEKGVLFDILGARGYIDMGIRREATVEEAMFCFRRRRRHRVVILNEIEEELREIKDRVCIDMEDISQWRRESGYKNGFSTRETWKQIREEKEKCTWTQGVWFSQATPKFAFMTWLACLNRLSTMDRTAKWSQGVDTICVLCKSADEDRDHLFFACSYSSQVWENLARGIMGDSYTNLWSSLIPLLTVRGMERRKRFCLRYAFQVAVYALWRERNRVKHGEKLMPWTVLRKILDKGVRNKLSILQANRVKGMERGLQTWFGARD